MNRDKFSEKELEEAWKNNSRAIKYKNGSVWDSKCSGRLTIIGRFNKDRLYIQFINTKTIAIKDLKSISNGDVKDPYTPRICNRGFIGEGKYGAKLNTQIYDRWTAMLKRCYGDREKSPSYDGCTVDSKWFNFQIYCSDMLELMEKQGLDNLDGYAIDKDIKIKGNKVYSKDTVSIVTLSENSKEMNDRIHDTVYVGINLNTREEIEFTNQAEFARKNNLKSRSISAILNNNYKRTGDWTFYKKGDKAPNIEDLCDTVYIAENINTCEKIEFTNRSQFARDYNVDRSNISKVINGKQKTVGGYRIYKKE